MKILYTAAKFGIKNIIFNASCDGIYPNPTRLIMWHRGFFLNMS